MIPPVKQVSEQAPASRRAFSVQAALKPRLFQGDFFGEVRQVPAGTVDLILTDPPWGILGEVQSWDVAPDLLRLEVLFDSLLKPCGQCLVFCDLNLLVNLLKAFAKLLKFRCYYIWKKPGGMPITLNRPIVNSEFILVFYKTGAKEKDLTWNPAAMGEPGEAYFKRNSSAEVPARRMRKSGMNRNLDGRRFPKVIIEAPGKPNMAAGERSGHPTQKPEILLRKLIRGYSNPGDLILDPFAGSGSTLISAFKEKRPALGFEIDATHFREADQRINQVTAQGSLW